MDYNTMEAGGETRVGGCLRYGCCQYLLSMCYTIMTCFRECWWWLCCCLKRTPLPDVYIIGKDTRVLSRVEDMVKSQLVRYKFRTSTEVVTTGDAFRDAHAYNRVILVCNRNRGNTILADPSNKEDISLIYQDLERHNVDVMVMYFGVPLHNISGCSQMFSMGYLGLRSTQPKVRKLMEKNRFMSIATDDNLNCAQRFNLLRWMVWLPERDTAQVIQTDLSIVGFSRRTLDNVELMLNGREIYQCKVRTDKHLLAKNDDFQPMQLKKKVLLVCSYTQRNNILGEPPDYGEMFFVHQKAEEYGVDIILMYAGVPPTSHSSDELFPRSYQKLLTSQPKLQQLMEQKRFMVVGTDFHLNDMQQRRLSQWLWSGSDMQQKPSVSHVEEGYSSYH